MALQHADSSSAQGHLSQVWAAQEKLHELRAQQMAVLHGEVAVLRNALDDHKTLVTEKLATLEDCLTSRIQRSADTAREETSSNARIIQEVQKAMSDLSELAFKASDLQGGIASSELADEVRAVSERLSNFPSPAALHRAVERHEVLATWVRETAALQEQARELAERRQDGMEQAIDDLRALLKARETTETAAEGKLESMQSARLAELESRVATLAEDLAEERKERSRSCKAISSSLKETFEETNSLTLLDAQSQHHIDIGRLEQDLQQCRANQEGMHRHVLQVRQGLQSSLDGIAAEVKGLAGAFEEFAESGKDVDSIRNKLQASLSEVPSALEDLGSRLDDIASKTQALQARLDDEMAEKIAADKEAKSGLVSLGEQPSLSEIVERLEDQISRLGESLRAEITNAKQQMMEDCLALNEESEHRVLDHLALATQQLRKDVEAVNVMLDDAKKTLQGREAAEEAALSREYVASPDQGGFVEALRQQLGHLRVEVTALSAVVDGHEADRELSGKMLEEQHSTLRSLQQECSRAGAAAAAAGDAAERFGNDQRALTEFCDQKFLSVSQQFARVEQRKVDVDDQQTLIQNMEKLGASLESVIAEFRDASIKLVELGSGQETLRGAQDDVAKQLQVLRQAVPSNLHFLEVQQSVRDVWETLQVHQKSAADAIAKLRQEGRDLEIAHTQISEEMEQLKNAVSSLDYQTKGNHDTLQQNLSDILQGVQAAKKAWQEELEQVQETARANLASEMTGLISSHDALVERVTTLAGELKDVDTVHQQLSQTVETRQARLQEQLDTHRRHCEIEQATLRRELVSACEDLLDLRTQAVRSEQGSREVQTCQEILHTGVQELQASLREHVSQAAVDRGTIKEMLALGTADRDEVRQLRQSIAELEVKCEDLARAVGESREWTEQQLGKVVESLEHQVGEENRSRVLAVADATSHNRRTRKWVEDWFNEATEDREKLAKAVEGVSDKQERLESKFKEHTAAEGVRVDQLLTQFTQEQQAVIGRLQECCETANTASSDLVLLRREVDQQVHAVQEAIERVKGRVASSDSQRIAVDVSRILQRQRGQFDADMGLASSFGKVPQSVPQSSLRSPPVLRYRSTDRSEEAVVPQMAGSPAAGPGASPTSSKRLVSVPTDAAFQGSAAPVAKGPLKTPDAKASRLPQPSAVALPAPASELMPDTPASRMTRMSSYGELRQSPTNWPTSSKPL
mmetsp:Transcript_1804/g.3897  ORF Transcript_1804/g.3897 Transcript_1804/m.3897 type:complete len:1212 (-) Transcript_1804:76-3711(-)